MDWLILILGVPAVLVPLVLLFGFAGCGPNASFCTEDRDCPQGTICDGEGRCVSEGEPFETDDPDEPPPPPPVSVPENLNATAIDDHSVLLTWTSNEPGATFKIERADEDGTNFTPLDIPAVPAGTIDDTSGLIEGVTFLYRVSAEVDGQTSLASDPSSATVLPRTPVGLTATAGSINQINLSWTNRSTATNVFSIDRRVSGGSFGPIGTVAGNSFSDTGADIGGLSGGTTYEYQVSATVVDGFEDSVEQPVNSAPSAIASATALGFTTAFTATLTTDQPGTQAICLVQRLRAALFPTNLTGTQVRITLAGPSAGSITLNRILISRPDPTIGADPYDSGPDLTDLVPGGGVTTLAAGGSAILGPVNYVFDSSQDLLIAFDISGTQGPFNLRNTSPLPGADQFGQFGLAEAGTPNRTTGYGVAQNILYFIEKIEVL